MSRPYHILALVERTEAWWQWRRTGIGSSDAASILGFKPAKTVERLWRDKLQLVSDDRRSFAREQAARLERTARAAYVQALGPVAPVCVQSTDRPWQRASLDGLSADGERVVEIKCGLAAFERASARRRPPPHHFAQLQHILSVTGLPAIDYWCYVPSRTPLWLEVHRDEPFIQRLLLAEEAFWARCRSAQEPVFTSERNVLT